MSKNWLVQISFYLAAEIKFEHWNERKNSKVVSNLGIDFLILKFQKEAALRKPGLFIFFFCPIDKTWFISIRVFCVSDLLKQIHCNTCFVLK